MKPLIRILLILCSSGVAFPATKLFLRDTYSAIKTVNGAITSGWTGATNCANGPTTTFTVWRLADNGSQGASTVTKTFTPQSTDPDTVSCWWQSANGAELLRWITPPLSAGFSVSGNADYAAGCNESQAAANAGFRFILRRWDVQSGAPAEVVHTSAQGTECANAKIAIAAAAVTTTSFNTGDRLVIDVEVQSVGGAWGGNNSRTISISYDGAAAGVGDTFVNLATPTLTFSSDTNNSRPHPSSRLRWFDVAAYLEGVWLGL